eukprot:CAMPEP_0179161090 /NCGR_PEP_ID=MMETSP0796-20121207/78824_1 /TAXON_ID=73915 /ORGANISM="Pyrodinium bahamense, Strain pbaha01" /LENGTH=61 /DNA_ID=CAMNT_0020863137 /DNA_START=22 /DNA_END=207 /DNA_ORIENTATION=+
MSAGRHLGTHGLAQGPLIPCREHSPTRGLQSTASLPTEIDALGPWSAAKHVHAGALERRFN